MAVQKEYEASANTITPTGLSGLLNNEMCALSAEQTGGSYEFMDFIFTDSSMTVTARDVVGDLYINRAVDGTNYADAPSDADTIDGGASEYVGTFSASDTISGGAVRLHLHDIPVPPGKWKAQVRNKSGETFDGTPTLAYRQWRRKDA